MHKVINNPCNSACGTASQIPNPMHIQITQNITAVILVFLLLVIQASDEILRHIPQDYVLV